MQSTQMQAHLSMGLLDYVSMTRKKSRSRFLTQCLFGAFFSGSRRFGFGSGQLLLSQNTFAHSLLSHRDQAFTSQRVSASMALCRLYSSESHNWRTSEQSRYHWLDLFRWCTRLNLASSEPRLTNVRNPNALLNASDRVRPQPPTHTTHLHSQTMVYLNNDQPLLLAKQASTTTWLATKLCK